jgi:hypothetical protein
MQITDTPLASETEAALERLVHHTLEVMCFAEAERVASPLPIAGAGRAILARIDFSGGCGGSLQLEVEPAVARALAASSLGLEPAHRSLAGQTGDAIQELARVLCGRLITSLHPAAAFEMKPAAPGSRASKETVRQAFRVPAGTLCITLQMS